MIAEHNDVNRRVSDLKQITMEIFRIVRPVVQSSWNLFDCRHCSFRAHTKQELDSHMKSEHNDVNRRISDFKQITMDI